MSGCRHNISPAGRSLYERGIDLIFLPKQLGSVTIAPEILKEDKKHCRRFGPCGIGKKALYLNSFFIDRMYYVPISSVRRIYKRVAMSKGGFTGKGIFASIPYLVVEYENGQEKQCIFKVEEMADQMIRCFHEDFPDIPIHSREAEKRLEEKHKALEQKKKMLENSKARDTILSLESAAVYLEKQPALHEEMSAAARKKRIQERTNPAYRWAALAIILMGCVSFIYGIYALTHHLGNAMYFLLFGLAAVFLFSGANVLPTRKNNAAYVQKALTGAQDAMQRYIDAFPDFPVPACYAHPVVLRRMQEILAMERAGTVKEALEVLKGDLKSLNSSVTVDQETYEDVMKIKPLFLVMD